MKCPLASVIGLLSLVVSTVLAASAPPAVLFSQGVHTDYVVKPLVDLGFAVDTCPRGELAQRLATDKYNVVVVATMTDAERAAVDQFLSRGGGVFVANPTWHPETENFTATCRWLESRGARERWEMLQDSNPSNIVRDVMGCRLSSSDDVAAPFNQDVRGVLTLLWNHTSGVEPPMSFDFSPDWKVIVRGAASLKTVVDKRNDVSLQPWIPTNSVVAPPLLAIREQAPGRLAVAGLRVAWIFRPPPNCPTAEAMLTAGSGGRPSDWLRVFAHTFRWLAEPSLQAGLGGATTPDKLLNPPIEVWEKAPAIDWTKVGPMQDQLQTPGLIGARTALSSGAGSVADYVREAKAAGLKFIVFLEDSLKLDQARWDQLVQQCATASSAEFAAVPGLTYEDAQGNHLYAFADKVRFFRPGMLLPDRRLATTQPMRTRAYFDYVNELLQQQALTGFWRHRENLLIPADYKLYNSFPIYTSENGQPVDAALDEYLYLQGIGGCQGALAFEIMTSPDQVAARAQNGWRVVANRPPQTLQGKWHNGVWSFSGSGSQYITQGPVIQVWDAPNRLAEPRGEWWRPDLWQYRLRLRVAAAAGLRSVTIHDGDRGVLRRWQPGGAPQFEQELILANCQQLGPVLIVEDENGHRAISMAFWNRNLISEEFFCSDRCNFLGNNRLRDKDGRQVWCNVGFTHNMGVTPSKGRRNMAVQPAVSLTPAAPTLPVDGAPAGFPTCALNFEARLPGELPHLFAYPITYLVGPEIAIGQDNSQLGYDPQEQAAVQSPLGHPYQQPQHGWGNAWGSWHKLIPTRQITGWTRTHACNWMPGRFRIGWHETRLTLKTALTLGENGAFPVLRADMPGWTLWHEGRPVPASHGDFTRGLVALLEHPGGCVVVAPWDGPLQYTLSPQGAFELRYAPGAPTVEKGQPIHYRVAFAGAAAGTPRADLEQFARQFGLSQPGTVAYRPQLTRGQQLDNHLVWRLAAHAGAIAATLPRTELLAFLPVQVNGLNDNWSVWLLDRARPKPNYRALPIRDGTSYAQLDLTEQNADIFLGHPITGDDPSVTIHVAWKQPGVWHVEAHNPGDKPVKVKLQSARDWTPFRFRQTADLAAGRSVVWDVPESQ